MKKGFKGIAGFTAQTHTHTHSHSQGHLPRKVCVCRFYARPLRATSPLWVLLLSSHPFVLAAFSRSLLLRASVKLLWPPRKETMGPAQLLPLQGWFTCQPWLLALSGWKEGPGLSHTQQLSRGGGRAPKDRPSRNSLEQR